MITKEYIDNLVETLNSNNEEDVIFARKIVLEQLVNKDEYEYLIYLSNRLKETGWVKNNSFPYVEVICRLINSTNYNFYDYSKTLGNKFWEV